MNENQPTWLESLWNNIKIVLKVIFGSRKVVIFLVSIAVSVATMFQPHLVDKIEMLGTFLVVVWALAAAAMGTIAWEDRAKVKAEYDARERYPLTVGSLIDQIAELTKIVNELKQPIGHFEPGVIPGETPKG